MLWFDRRGRLVASVQRVSELGDLLERLHGPARFRSLRGVFRVWRHEPRVLEAFHAAHPRQGGFAMVAQAGGGEAPSETERKWCFSVEPPDRLREEWEPPWANALGVRDGRRWWSYSEQTGAIAGEDTQTTSSGIGQEIATLIYPAELLSVLEFEPAGFGARAGRQVQLARATPRPQRSGPPLDFSLHHLGVGATEYALDVDTEHGVLLRVEARRDGQAFMVREATEIAFNEPMPDDTFVFRAPGGEVARPASELFPRPLRIPIDEAARRAPFTVWIPTLLPDDWSLRDVTLLEAASRPPRRAYVNLRYSDTVGTGGLSISQTPIEPPEPLPSGRQVPQMRVVTEGGVEMQVIDRGERWPQAQLRCVKAGTAVTMHSLQLDGDTMAKIAASLIPAPTTPTTL